MKRIFLFACIISLSLNLFAQSFEGKIVFEMSFPDFKDPQMAALLPKEAVAYFKNNQSRMEMNMMMGMKNATISDGLKKTSITLMDLMGQKYAVENNASNDAEQKKVMESTKVSITAEKKMIAGYMCTKALVEIPNPEKAKEWIKIDMWFTKDLSINKNYMNGPIEKIDGSVLEFSLNQSGMKINLSAKEILKQPVSDDLFLIPTGYKRMSSAELMKMMGGK